MRDMVEMGLNLENCELWFERAVVAAVGVMFILMVIRVSSLVPCCEAVIHRYMSLQMHTLIALSRYQRHLARDHFASSKSHTSLRSINTDSLHRIYLLPTPTSPPSTSFSFNHFDTSAHARSNSDNNIVVYAPVPVGGMSEQEARKMNATEAWIPLRQSSDGASTPRAHGHRRTRSSSAHSHRHHSSVPRVPAVRREACAPVDEKSEMGPLV